MHNIHGYWINLKVLFKYLKNEYKGKIISKNKDIHKKNNMDIT